MAIQYKYFALVAFTAVESIFFLANLQILILRKRQEARGVKMAMAGGRSGEVGQGRGQVGWVAQVGQVGQVPGGPVLVVRSQVSVRQMSDGSGERFVVRRRTR